VSIVAVGNNKAVRLIGIYHWLAQVDAHQKSDVIFVLAGRESRKCFGLRLLKEGWGDRLLLSVGRFEIRRFCDLPLPVSLDLRAIAAKTAPKQRHYFFDVEGGRAECHRIDIGRFGTWSEVLAFSNWLHKNQAIRSATIVSSGFHIRRIRICCRWLVRGNSRLTFLAVPEEDDHFRTSWWRDSKYRQLVLKELAKLPVYKMLGRVRIISAFFNYGSPRCGRSTGRQKADRGGRDVVLAPETTDFKTAPGEATTAQLLDSGGFGGRIVIKHMGGNKIWRRS
jgi:hypothetical protein